MRAMLETALGRIVRFGALTVTFADGRARTYGDGSEAPLAIRFTDAAAERAVALDPAMKLGEMFMEERLLIEEGGIYEVLSLLKRNGLKRGANAGVKALHALRIASMQAAKLLPRNTARRDVAHHYDLDAGLFDLFLDADRQYSCAYYEHPDQSLDDAQRAKKRHIAAKLLVTEGDHVLDIGCGWGGLGLYLADVAGAGRVTGITLSERQLAVARRRAEARGLAERVRFELRDWREIEGPFDRIVSVGMFEHVGTSRYRAFFARAAELLERRHGVMVLHSIGRPKRAFIQQPWSEKYIFPGGYIPALSEVLPAVEGAGFLVKDIEILPIHYARTLCHWRERFMARREEAKALYDERFCRMWEFYLASAETGFRHDRLMIFQIQLARHQDAVPFTRDYIAERKAELARREEMLGRAAEEEGAASAA